MEVVQIQPDTKLAKIVKLVGSKKRKAMIANPRASVTIRGTDWDGGSRSEYFLVNLLTWRSQPLAATPPARFGGPAERPDVAIDPHQVVVEVGTFLGKPATPTIFFHPDLGRAYFDQH